METRQAAPGSIPAPSRRAHILALDERGRRVAEVVAGPRVVSAYAAGNEAHYSHAGALALAVSLVQAVALGAPQDGGPDLVGALAAAQAQHAGIRSEMPLSAAVARAYAAPRTACPACEPESAHGAPVSHVFCAAHGAAYRAAVRAGAKRPIDAARAAVSVVA